MRNFIICTHIIRQVKSRRMRWAGHVARLGEERKVYKTFVGKPEGKRPLGRPRRRWEDRDRWRAVVSAVMNLRFLAPRI
jgi:hypothetical protein